MNNMESTSTQNNYTYTIYDQGRIIRLDDRGYLNYLLEESRNKIYELNKREISSLIYEFNALRDDYSFKNYLTTIESEIHALRRVLDYELIHENKTRKTINSFLMGNSNSLQQRPA